MGRKYGQHRHLGPQDGSGSDGDQGSDATQALGDQPWSAFDSVISGGTNTSTTSVSSLANGVTLGPTTGGLAMVEFLTGLNSSRAQDTTDPNFWNWNANDPATYTGAGTAHVWQPGSTVSYWFDTASNWTTAEKAAFTDALNLWSAIANIKFAVSNAASLPASAIDITRGSTGQANTTNSYAADATLGMGLTTAATVSIDTSVAGWTSLGSYSVSGGFGPQTVLHELGHALGLGHSGPYNGSVASSQVIYTADTRQYTVMSYVNVGSGTASTVATRNGDTPSPAVYFNAYGTFNLTTPGQYDILAIQRLYGAATSSPLTTGETFGFNASAALTSTMPAYDFTVNTNPVVTIYDAGSGNTLDLSGFTNASTVDLNPGQFSSVDGMVDNIGIAFNTFIDTAIGGSASDTFYVNAQSDTINGGGGTKNKVVFPNNRSNYTLLRNGGMVTVSSGGITDTITNIQTLVFADQSVTTSGIACFAIGTRIRTPEGDVAVEALREGMLVCTASGGTRPVKWIGHRTIDLVAHPHPPAAAPVRIRRDAFGDGLPRHDLLLSPDHAVLAGDVLIPACLLVNGCTIVQELATASITYLHVELDRHDIVLAEGLAVESYLDTGNRAMFANAGLALILHPDCSVRCGVKRWEHDACAPLVTEGDELRAVRQHLLARVASQGYRTNADPRLRLVADGREMLPIVADADRHVFALPAGARRLHLRSHSAVPVEVPVEVHAHDHDRRALGVAVSRMILTQGHDRWEVPMDHPGLHHGWHAVERDGASIWRWTNGAALVSLRAPVPAGTMLELRTQGHLPRYWTAAAPMRLSAA